MGVLRTRPRPTVEEACIAGHTDHFVFEVGVVQAGAGVPIGAAGAVPYEHLNSLVADLAQVGDGVVGGADVPGDVLLHEQVFCGLAVHVGFHRNFVVEQAELKTDVDLFALFPFHVGVGGSRECSAGIEHLVVGAKGVSEGVLYAGHVAQRSNAIRTIHTPRGAYFQEAHALKALHEVFFRYHPAGRS